MLKPVKKKICIVAHSLGGGGLERVAAMQSVYLTESNYDVYIVTILDNLKYSYKGELFNLGLYKRHSKFNRILRFIKLNQFLNSKEIDIIIDHRPRTRWLSEWLISSLLYRKPTIYTVHNFKLNSYIPTKNKFLNRAYRQSKKVVSVSNAIEQKIIKDYGITNVKTIYNPIDLSKSDRFVSSESPLDYPYILWYGRLDDHHKNLKLLIKAYMVSQLPKRQIKLVILGNGPDEVNLKQYVSDNEMEKHIAFINHVQNPLDFVTFSKFVVLTSRYEGFPMVLPEALSCGVPVISTDCQSGPSEIITHKINGLLVENYNEMALSKAMNEFLLNDELYQKCKQNAKRSVRNLDISEIKKQWIKIIEDE